jgi:hypothetical protein
MPCRAGRGKLLHMNSSAANSSVSPPRRFILMPEEPVDRAGEKPRIRRYQLASFAQGAWPCSGEERGGTDAPRLPSAGSNLGL